MASDIKLNLILGQCPNWHNQRSYSYSIQTSANLDILLLTPSSIQAHPLYSELKKKEFPQNGESVV